MNKDDIIQQLFWVEESCMAICINQLSSKNNSCDIARLSCFSYACVNSRNMMQYNVTIVFMIECKIQTVWRGLLNKQDVWFANKPRDAPFI